MRYPVVSAILLITLCASASPAADPWDPAPCADGKDIFLPMPGGGKMTFRPIRIGKGDGPYALRRISLGDSEEKPREAPTAAVIGGAFNRDLKGNPLGDWVFYMGKYEITEAQYDAVMKPEGARKSQLPVTRVSWFDVNRFVEQYNHWLLNNAKDSLPSNGRNPGYLRLPTEIEWEYAARGGAEVTDDIFTRPHPYGDNVREFEWYAAVDSSNYQLRNIGVKKANPAGLHDMLSNAEEITSSFYQLEYYQGRVGGFVARGGNAKQTEMNSLRASLRSEQPLWREESGGFKPHSKTTMSFRLVISDIVFTGPEASALIEEHWKEWRDGDIGKFTPARMSEGPDSRKVHGGLQEAGRIVDQLKATPGASKDLIKKLEAQFTAIGAEINRAEVKQARVAATRAVDRAYLLAVTLHRQNKVSTMLAEISKNESLKADTKQRMIAGFKARLTDMDKELAQNAERYRESVGDLGDLEAKWVDQGVKEVEQELKDAKDVQRLIVFTRALDKHLLDYRKVRPARSRVPLDQWVTDVRDLKMTFD